VAGGLAFDIVCQGENDLIDLAGADVFDQGGQIEFGRPDSLRRRQAPVQDVVDAAPGPRCALAPPGRAHSQTTHTSRRSRRGSPQIAQSSDSVRLPHRAQRRTARAAFSSAAIRPGRRSGFSTTKCSAIRSAERYPRPGKLLQLLLQRFKGRRHCVRTARHLQSRGHLLHLRVMTFLGLLRRILDGGEDGIPPPSWSLPSEIRDRAKVRGTFRWRLP